MWISEPGNLYASTLVRIDRNDRSAAQLGFVAAVSLHQALCAWVSQKRVMLKWPNDLLLDGRKLSGILLERHGEAVIAGFGVNLAHHPEDTDRPAISLGRAGIDAPSPEQFLAALAERWAYNLGLWRSAGFDPIRSAWLAEAHPAGAALVARLADGGERRGTFEEIDGEGALLLRQADGRMETIHAGDVFML